MKHYDVIKTRYDAYGAVAITSMVIGKNGKIYIGLTAYGHTLLELDPQTDKITDLGEIFPERRNNTKILDKIHNSLAVDDDGRIYIGQGLNIAWCAWPYDFDLHKYGGGHLYSYDPNSGKLEDYGVQVPYNAIHGITIDKKNRKVFGYTIPDNHFFVHDLTTHEVKDYGKISNYCSHNLVADKMGNVYGAWKKEMPFLGEKADSNGFFMKGVYLLRYDAQKEELVRTRNLIVYGPEYDIFANVGIDSWICTSSGEIYGGTAIGGSIFKVNPDLSIQHIGKPVLTPRLTGMVEHTDGLIYGGAGFPHMHLFTLNPRTNEIKDLGVVTTDGEFCYFHGMVITNDGVIYAGETDAGKACLYKLIPRDSMRA